MSVLAPGDFVVPMFIVVVCTSRLVAQGIVATSEIVRRRPAACAALRVWHESAHSAAGRPRMIGSLCRSALIRIASWEAKACAKCLSQRFCKVRVEFQVSFLFILDTRISLLTSFELVFLGPSQTPASSPEPQHLHLKKTRMTPCHPVPHTEPTP
jgi:hypothetical protein